MKKGSLLDNVATWAVRLAALVSIDQAIYAQVITNWAENWEKKGNSKLSTLNNLQSDASYSDPRAYLEWANGLIQKDEVNGAVCRDYAKATLEEFRKIVVSEGKPDLAYLVRSAYDGSVKGGHNWLEIYEEGGWIPFETMQKTPRLDKSGAREHSFDIEEQRSFLNGNPDRKASVFCYTNGECHQTSQAYLSPGGNLGLVAKAFLGN